VCFDLSVEPCYNRYMNAEMREEIVAKLAAKKVAVEKKLSKPKNKIAQRQMYVDAIAEHEKKIEKLQALIAKIDESSEDLNVEISLRESEVEHMEEILSRFDRGMKEREECVATMKRRIDALTMWTPENPVSVKDNMKTDKEYLKAFARREYLDRMLPECVVDVQRIFYSRGDISEFNVKGRKGV